MKVYDEHDEVEMYFVIAKRAPDLPDSIIAWTDNEDMMEFYLEFHECKEFKVKTVVGNILDISKILDENYNEEIGIHYMSMRDRDSRYRILEGIPLPLTGSESQQLNATQTDILASYINYNLTMTMFPHLKDKYKDALIRILLPQISELVIYGHDPLMLRHKIRFDEVVLLIRLFKPYFGE